ncbi:MAG: type IV pilus assembly protein PilM [Gemmatimonadales bacterium]|nr:MAG: type IV pilus assembly protein PilM [Gemmatimonadales bacterium]
MGLFGRKKSSVGLDIGSGFVKLIEVDHSGDQPEVTRVAIRPLMADAIVEGEVMDPGLVADTIRGLLEDSGIDGRAVVTAIGGHDVIVKKISMDRMTEEDAREVIRWEAEQHVPFDIQSVELDFQILDPQGTGSEMSVLLVAAKRDLVESKLSLLRDSELEARVIDVDSFALHNALERNHPEAMKGIVALVNVGHEMTNVNILEEGVPILTRDIAFGTRRLREDLQREQGLAAEEADAVLAGRQSIDGLDRYVDGAADEVSVGVERAAAFLMAQQAGEGLGRVFLSGGGALVNGFPEALAERMGVEITVVNPFERVPMSVDAPFEVDVLETAPMLLLPLGLALRSP